MTNNKQRELIKTYVTYNDLDTLMSRKKIIIDTVNNAINRENQDNDYILSYNDDQVLVQDDKYVLMITINKDYK